MKKTITGTTSPLTFTTNCQSDIANLYVFGKTEVSNENLVNVDGTFNQPDITGGGIVALNLKGVNDIKDIYCSKSFNIWDEEWEVGGISDVTGEDVPFSGIRSKGFNICSSNEDYYCYIGSTTNVLIVYFYNKDNNFISTARNTHSFNFTTPPNTVYFRIALGSSYGATYKNDICINKSNTYINGLYAPNSATDFVIHRVDGVDLGSLDWTLLEGYNNVFISSSIPAKYSGSTSVAPNMLCGIYETVAPNAVSNMKTTLTSGQFIIVQNSNFAGDAVAFKTAMSGVYLQYELATPTIEYLTPTIFKQIIGSNNISHNSSVAPDMELEYYYNSLVINNKVVINVNRVNIVQLASLVGTDWELRNATFSASGQEITVTSNTDSSTIKCCVLKLVQGHIYYICGSVKTTSSNAYIQLFDYSSGSNIYAIASADSSTYVYGQYLYTASSNSAVGIRLPSSASNGDTATVKNFMCIDLTDTFGSYLADNVIDIDWFKLNYPEEHYPYNTTPSKNIERIYYGNNLLYEKTPTTAIPTEVNE